MKKILLACINFYRRHLSSMKGYSSCKYYPTCSEYAKQAVMKYGVIKGCLYSIKRIIRCNPFSKGGYDPLK